MNDAIARIEAAVRRSVDAGDPNSIAMVNQTGGIEKYDRRRRWWTDHHDQFAAASAPERFEAHRAARRAPRACGDGELSEAVCNREVG
jgi:hypothetical protein